VIAQPCAEPEPAEKFEQAIAALAGPFTPVLVPIASEHAPSGLGVLPIAPDATVVRLIARLASALRVRTLHATVLRRASSRRAPRAAEGDPLEDATILVTGRGRSYPALTTAVGERVGLIGALSVETAARYLNARDVDGIVVGDGFGPRTVEAFLTAMMEDSRFRDLPIALVPALPDAIDAIRLPNLERVEGAPAEMVERIMPMVRLHAFESRLRRQLAAIDAKGMLDPRTGLFTVSAFLRDLTRVIEDAKERSGAASIARFSFPARIDARASLDAARLVSRLVRKVDFACRAEDGSILLVFAETALGSAHVVARRIASVLRHTMLSPAQDGKAARADASITLAALKPTDTVESLLARVCERPVAAA
jgi:GGDEF domain-containing protein